MRIVVDANVVASGVFWSGPPSEVLKRWLRGMETLLVSAPILEEYRDVLERLAGGTNSTVARWNLLLTELGERVEPRRLGGLCRDPKDEMYLEAAVGGRADAIVSGDKDVLVMRNVLGIPILSPRAFLMGLSGG